MPPSKGEVMSIEAPRAPWREVVDVQIMEGPKGGRIWSLTLECGHHKPARIPPARLHRLGIDDEAPKRCRCVACEIQKYAGF